MGSNDPGKMAFSFILVFHVCNVLKITNILFNSNDNSMALVNKSSRDSLLRLVAESNSVVNPELYSIQHMRFSVYNYKFRERSLHF
jgi:hypothetical protein